MDTLEVVQFFSCLGKITALEFCCRSEYILCTLAEKPTVQVSAPDAWLTQPCPDYKASEAELR